MKLGERLAAAIRRLTHRSASQAGSLPRGREGTAAPSAKDVKPLPEGSAKHPAASGGRMPEGTAKRPASSAAVPEGTAKQAAASAAAPKGTAKQGASSAQGQAVKKRLVPKAGGETAPKKEAAALPQGSAKQASAANGRMPEGTAKRPVSSGAAVPKGTGESAPARLQGAQVKGSSQAVPQGRNAAMPNSSWQDLPQRGAARQTETGTVSFSSLTEEIVLTGPPPDPARQLSELLRVQRRMNPGAMTFGEEVL